jgi:pimeloyl-ACP methyl ester carboxylesterase
MPFVDVAGAQVEYDRTGSGPDLLLVHSLLTEMTVFAGVLPALAANHRVTRVNLPGFGASSPVALESVAAYADHLARCMDALDLPRDTAVFGNGFGAFVVVSLGIRHGARFGKMMVADVVPAFPEAARAPFRMMAEKVRSGGMQTVLDAAIGRMLPPTYAGAHPDVVAERKRRLGAVDAGCFAQACLGLAQLNLAPELASIDKPTLVMCGVLDQTTPPDLARALAVGIPGAAYRDIDGSGHCPMLEQPATLVRLMQEFLSH